ncbi:1-phosphatidylinositol phosphodiesterase [Fulvia fulva]|nr:1-phosphatidylinositol phosphodiesterase [Fulvia fulva]WPV09459.1 1-phosphatidylinositol phosphodiesterase [Fulvia fulva]WPV24561.1 1-phosphatidylinositol phosphodiesterase [Fulvia fulva]
MTMEQQLDAGIRYFDLRCGIVDDIAEMVHGAALLGLKLPEVMNTIYKWLDAHPTEAIIVQIKEDRESERSTVHFAQAIFACVSTRSERWRTANTTPTLGELRGKIQLFRRYRGPNLWAYGIDVTQWQDNPSVPFTITTQNMVQLTIQDHYSFSDPQSLPALVAIKGGDVSGLLERASKDLDPGHWYINFTSAYEFNFYYQLTPRAIATGGHYQFRWIDGINVRLHNWLRTRVGRQHYGIVAMDFPDTDLVSELIRSNFKKHNEPVWLVMLCIVLSIAALALMVLHLAGFSSVQELYPGISSLAVKEIGG